MILVDYSSIMHRMIYSSITSIKPPKIDGKIRTEDFISLTKYFIFEELFKIKQEFGNEFGDVIICLDRSSNGYWRKDVYPAYKQNRKKTRDESDFDYKEVFAELEGLLDQIILNLPWKVVDVEKAEADDIMLHLAKVFHKDDKILLYTPDKDMIQAQRGNDTVKQWSSLTKKWIVPENKHDNMDQWIQEHVCLGDDSDGVPKIVDQTVFSDNFIQHLSDNNIDKVYHDVYTFKYGIIDAEGALVEGLTPDIINGVLSTFTIEKKNRKKEPTGVLDVYKDMRFGPTSLEKAIKKYGTLDKWLDSDPLYRQHYERNFTLVMEEGIPDYIRDGIMESFKNAKTDYNEKEFVEYLEKDGLSGLKMTLPSVFKPQGELSAEFFGW